MANLCIQKDLICVQAQFTDLPCWTVCYFYGYVSITLFYLTTNYILIRDMVFKYLTTKSLYVVISLFSARIT